MIKVLLSLALFGVPTIPGAPPPAAGTVTLLTGDRVVVSASGHRVEPAQGRRVRFTIRDQDTPGLDPLELAVNTLSATKGTLFVIAAGNDGGPGTVNSPGSADVALTVGAVDRDDRTAEFSSRGPRSFDHAVKPDISAPGTDIVAANLGGGHIAHNGTSMAAPHVAGAAAIIAQQHPDWNGERIKAALVESAKAGTGWTALVTNPRAGSGRRRAFEMPFHALGYVVRLPFDIEVDQFMHGAYGQQCHYDATHSLPRFHQFCKFSGDTPRC
ncbi:S8 family serine peptidase [Nonomuraea sp. NPDC051941]|uniref:S8 family serine peptidase n=1 Tax=Nonomuraea sp. NPDC051941 TaxID=3364373 RepID=UPI0037C5A3B0